MFSKFKLAALAFVGVEANYKSAEVRTYERFQYGLFKTRLHGCDQKGTVASFFLFWDGPGWDANQWNEIDVEIVPTQPNAFRIPALLTDKSRSSSCTRSRLTLQTPKRRCSVAGETPSKAAFRTQAQAAHSLGAYWPA